MSDQDYKYIENPLQVTRREFLTITGIVTAFLALPAIWIRSVAASSNDYIKARTKNLYQDDIKSKIRVSHANKSVARYYKEFGGKPLSHLSEELLHTKYINRTKALS
ncbi:hypothetical protein ER57_13895 [Smithella sp. SCADC]|jgi:ferredoxin hydrogenase small subunit|nr:hypothetical protein ER57_13895 [Smithella sp. SCADC]